MADIKADVPNAHILCNLMMKYGVCFVPQRCHCISDQWHYIRHSVSHWRGVNYKEKNPWDRAWCPHIQVSRAHRPYSCPPVATRLAGVKMEKKSKKVWVFSKKNSTFFGQKGTSHYNIKSDLRSDEKQYGGTSCDHWNVGIILGVEFSASL